MKRFIKKINIIILIILFLFFLINVKHGWFPSSSIIKKHPKELKLSFKQGGYIKKLLLNKGDYVSNNQSIAILENSKYDQLKTLEKEFIKKNKINNYALNNSINRGATENFIKGLREKKIFLESELIDIQKELNLLRFSCEIIYDKEFKGQINQFYKTNSQFVIQNEPVVSVIPYESYYLIKKTLAIFSFILFSIYFLILKKINNIF